MEARLGADLSDVRIHADSAAQRAAETVNARAFTAGSHIAFQRSQYDPASAAGRQTLAHELTHVIQQRSGPVTGIDHGGVRVSEPSDRFERAAEENARRAMSGTARFRAGRHAAAPVRATRGAAVIQRYTEAGDAAGTLDSQGGVYKVVPGEPTVWVLDGEPVNGVLKKVRVKGAPTSFAGYTAYQVGRQVLKDCLHAAEEIINKRPGELEPGGLHSTIEVKIRGGGTEIAQFGEGYDENVALAKRFAGAKNTRADPQPGEAFVIIAISPLGTMSPYHAAAVVGRDGDDAITLETWAGRGQSLPKADMYQVGSRSKSFHSHWTKQYFGGSDPVTVVVGPADPGDLEPVQGSKKRKNTNV
jgi:hypothetical protein